LRRFNTEGGVAPVAPTEFDVPADLDKGGVPDDEAEQEAADVLDSANKPDNDDASGASA
jgi:flagellar biosynthetic protein FlhB